MTDMATEEVRCIILSMWILIFWFTFAAVIGKVFWDFVIRRKWQ